VKDRICLAMINAAEKQGLISPERTLLVSAGGRVKHVLVTGLIITHKPGQAQGRQIPASSWRV